MTASARTNKEPGRTRNVFITQKCESVLAPPDNRRKDNRSMNGLAALRKSGHAPNMKPLGIIALVFFMLSSYAETRLLYVAAPGIRNYLEYGGHGILVFNIDDGHKFVRRIPSAGL